MSQLSKDIETKFDDARSETETAQNSEEPRVVADSITKATVHLHDVERLVGRMKPGLLADGINALLREQSGRVRELFLRSMGEGPATKGNDNH